jgi:hypothetical protein
MQTLSLRTVVNIATITFLMLGTRYVSAQTVTVPETSIRRINANGTDAPERGSAVNRTVISLDDCIEDRGYEIAVNTTGGTEASVALQIWAGGVNCGDLMNRTPVGGLQQCWKAYNGDVPKVQTNTIVVKVRDILASIKTKNSEYVAASIDVCSSAPEGVYNLYFLWLNSVSQTTLNQATIPFTVDVAGPVAPTNVRIGTDGTGDGILIPKWDAPTDINIDGYRAYCDDGTLAATAADASVDSAPDASFPDAAEIVDSGLSDASSLQDASDPDASDGSVVEVDSGIVDAGKTPVVDTSAEAGTSTRRCTSVVLVAGKRPPATLKPCQSTSGGTLTNQIVIPNLTNGKQYAVAIAAVDRVGNPGVLSEVTCGTPTQVDTFFDQYKNAGGGAGGCSSASATPSMVVSGIGLLAIASLAVRRRRSSK